MKGLGPKAASWGSAVAKGFGAATLAVGVFATAAGVKAVDAAGDFEVKLAKIHTVASKDVRQSLGQLRKDILALDPALGSAGQLGESAFAALANGISDSKVAMDIAKTSAMAAKAGFADFGETTSALVGLMNAYKGESLSASELGDRFVKVTQLGSAEVSDLARGIGDLSGVSKLAKVSQDELLAAIATGSNTQKAAQVMTGLKAALSNLIEPNEKALDAAKRLGLHGFGPAMLKADGFVGTLRKIAGATKGNAEDLAALFGSVEATNVIAGLTGDVEGLASNLNELKNSTGANKEAFETITDTLPAKLETLGNQINKNLINIGAPFIPHIKALVDQAISILQTSSATMMPLIEAAPGALAAAYRLAKDEVMALLPQATEITNSILTGMLPPTKELAIVVGTSLVQALEGAKVVWKDVSGVMQQVFEFWGEGRGTVETFKLVIDGTLGTVKDLYNGVAMVADGLLGTMHSLLDITNQVLEKLSQFTGTATAVGSQLMQGNLKGAMAAAGAGEGLQNAVGTVSDTVARALPGVGPLYNAFNPVQRASEGPAMEGQPTMMHSGEVFVPQSNGSVVGMDQMYGGGGGGFGGGGGGGSVSAVLKSARKAVKQISKEVESAVAKATGKGTGKGIEDGARKGVGSAGNKEGRSLIAQMSSGAAGALVDGFMSGDVEGGIKGFAKSMASTAKTYLMDALKQALGQKIFKSLFSGGIGGFLADGGITKSGTPYVVGERGPELFVPPSNGRVLSHEDSRRAVSQSIGGGGGGFTINIDKLVVTAAPGADGEQQLEKIAQGLERKYRRGNSTFFAGAASGGR